MADLVGVLGQGDAFQLGLAVSSNRQSSTWVACDENRAKLMPWPSQVAPGGKGSPSRRRFLLCRSMRFPWERCALRQRRSGL